MSIIQGNAHQGSTRGFYPKVINGSLRFNSGDAPYLSYTNGTATNGKKCTLSFWIKKNEIIGSTTTARFIQAYSGVGNQFHCQWGDGATSPGDQWNISPGEQSSQQGMRMTDASLRDPSAWYHCVWKYNSESGSEESTLYINGVQQSSSVYTTAPTTNLVTSLTKSGTEVKIGYINSSMPDFQLADMYVIDGQALTASDFGETKNGVWVAKDYAGTFGTNGFYLTFEDDTQVEAFNTLIYDGAGANTQVTGAGFQPDFIWHKTRGSGVHILQDSVRGGANYLVLGGGSGIDPEGSTTATTFDSDGFTIGQGNWAVSGTDYVAWCWEAGGAPTVDNSAGAGNTPTTGSVKIDGVDSTSALAGSLPAIRLSANTTYGFSIVTWQANNQTAGTVAHGLGVAPDMVIVKNRDSSTNAQWVVGHSGFGFTGQGYLNTAGSFGTNSGSFNNTAPTSTVFTVGTDQTVNLGTNKYIGYCWAEKSGYSAFGSFSGSGATDQTIYTTDDKTSTGANGFKPAFILIKRTNAGYDWVIIDNTRDTLAPHTASLFPNLPYVEYSGSEFGVTFNSDGFTLNGDSASINASGGAYIYAAFADTREAAFWLDQSGNNNDWQPVNLDHNDTVADSPTDNFATLNPLKSVDVVFSDGNLVCTHAPSSWRNARSSIGLPSTGKYYAEVEMVTTSIYWQVGVVTDAFSNTTFIGAANDGNSFGWQNGVKLPANTSYGSAGNAGDIFMIAVDRDAGELYLGKNGEWFNSSNPATNTSPMIDNLPSTGELFFAAGMYAGAKHIWNFGQQPFKYDPPA